MKILIEVQENKAAFLMELLRNFPFVKARKVESEVTEGLKEAKLKKKYPSI